MCHWRAGEVTTSAIAMVLTRKRRRQRRRRFSLRTVEPGYVTWIRHWDLVSRIGYVSDTDTRRIRRRYVSAEYPFFSFFHEYWIRGLIRILITDTAQPNKSTLSCPRRPSRLASRFPHASRRNPAPRPHPAASCAPAAGDWLRASASSLAVDEPPSRLAGCQRRVSAPATCPCPLTQHPVHSSPVPTHGALGSTY